MRTKSFSLLHVELHTLQDLQVTHCLLLFHSDAGNPDKLIRPAFTRLRQRVTDYGLDPESLLHVGVPEVVDGQLASYDCCVECPFSDADDIRNLPGGRYAVLTVEKTPSRIAPAIRAFRGDYLPDHGLVPDEDRPVYEIYFKDTMEYCVPVR